jgi:hypothetical protein
MKGKAEGDGMKRGRSGGRRARRGGGGRENKIGQRRKSRKRWKKEVRTSCRDRDGRSVARGVQVYAMPISGFDATAVRLCARASKNRPQRKKRKKEDARSAEGQMHATVASGCGTNPRARCPSSSSLPLSHPLSN